MTRSRPIVSDQPAAEVWKLLRFFLDERAVARRIREVHDIPGSTQERNIRKQAVQLGQSLRQAEEYFEAARRVSLATRPTLAYYGATSLARALILLRLDGSHSYDALRAAERHNHHGLTIKRDFLSAQTDSDPSAIFSAIACELHTHATEGPWGNFALFYRALIAPAVVVRNTTLVQGAQVTSTADEVQGTVDIRPVEELIGRRIDLLTLIQQMPDMWLHATELQMEPAVCPGKFDLQTIVTPGDPSQTPPTPTRIRRQWSFYVYAATTDQKEKFKELVAQVDGMTILNEGAISIALRLEQEFDEGELRRVYIPDVVDSLTQRMFFIPEPDAFIVEPAAHLASLFCLGMLARYYPDKWMALIDRNVLAAELVDSVLAVIERKLPLLVLDQLTGLKHYGQAS